MSIFLLFRERERRREQLDDFEDMGKSCSFPQEPSPAAWASQNHPKNIKELDLKAS
jgi:hypothetical protein